MREALKDLILKTIQFQYHLTCTTRSIDRTIFSTDDDQCFRALSSSDLGVIIYNAIVEYSFNEFEMGESDFEDLHEIAFQERVHFNAEATDAAQLKYGFFGEVVLYSILKTILGADAIISKGHFYSPTENAEAKGYDAYHLIEKEGIIQLWFGETKFHGSYTTAVNDVLSKIQRSLSRDYLRRNLLAIRQNKEKIQPGSAAFKAVLDQWFKNPKICIHDELQKHEIELVYPVLILFEGLQSGYDASIKAVSDYIKDNHKVPTYDLTIKYRIFFILVPLEGVRAIKTQVLEWIKSKRPLLS